VAKEGRRRLRREKRRKRVTQHSRASRPCCWLISYFSVRQTEGKIDVVLQLLQQSRPVPKPVKQVSLGTGLNLIHRAPPPVTAAAAVSVLTRKSKILAYKKQVEPVKELKAVRGKSSSICWFFKHIIIDYCVLFIFIKTDAADADGEL